MENDPNQDNFCPTCKQSSVCNSCNAFKESYHDMKELNRLILARNKKIKAENKKIKAENQRMKAELLVFREEKKQHEKEEAERAARNAHEREHQICRQINTAVDQEGDKIHRALRAIEIAQDVLNSTGNEATAHEAEIGVHTRYILTQLYLELFVRPVIGSDRWRGFCKRWTKNYSLFIREVSRISLLLFFSSSLLLFFFFSSSLLLFFSSSLLLFFFSLLLFFSSSLLLFFSSSLFLHLTAHPKIFFLFLFYFFSSLSHHSDSHHSDNSSCEVQVI